MSSKIPTRGPEPWPDQSVEVGQTHGDEVTSMFDAVHPVSGETLEGPSEPVESASGEVPSMEEFFDQNDPYVGLTREPVRSGSAGPSAWMRKGRDGLRSVTAWVGAGLRGYIFDPVLLVPAATALAVGLLMGLVGQPWPVATLAVGVSLALLARVASIKLLLSVSLVLCVFAASWVLPGARPAFWMTQAVLLVAVASGRLR